MSLFDRGIRGNVQNPFSGGGDAGTVGYSNPRLPKDFNGNVQLALDAAFDYMFPQYKNTVNTPADLPSTAATGDYYIVKDDGDGKPAGYVWSDIGGMGSWNKRYDVDWSYEGLLSDAVQKTSAMYPAKYGSTDRDAQGNELTGDLAGQIYYGGNKPAQNMTLFANTSHSDGRIQVGNDLFPLTNGELNLGSGAKRFASLFIGNSVVVGNMTISSSLFETTDQQINFSSDLGASNIYGNSLTLDTLKIQPAMIEDSTGQIDFGSTNLGTTGSIVAGENSQLADIVFSNGSIATQSPALGFFSKDLNTIGTLIAENVECVTSFRVANILGSAETLDTVTGNLRLQSTGGGTSTAVEIGSDLDVLYDLDVDGDLTVLQTSHFPKVIVDSLLTIQKTGANASFTTSAGDIVLSPAGAITVSKGILPATDSAVSLGSTAKRFQNLYLASSISDGTTSISSSTLQSFRDSNVGVSAGMSLFWDDVNKKWSPSLADTEIDHRTIGHLVDGDSGHTQFAMLSGRLGGQTLIGGTAATQNLTLESTSNATKGLVLFASVPAPVTDNATDLGSASRNFKDLYTLGVHKNMRFESFAGPTNYPSNSGAKAGRAIFDSVTNQLLVDTGAAWAKIGQQKWLSDTAWDGTITTLTVDVSSAISDARSGIWQLADNTNGFERVYAKLTFTQTAVTITVNTPLPAGSYRLIGLN